MTSNKSVRAPDILVWTFCCGAHQCFQGNFGDTVSSEPKAMGDGVSLAIWRPRQLKHVSLACSGKDLSHPKFKICVYIYMFYIYVHLSMTTKNSHNVARHYVRGATHYIKVYSNFSGHATTYSISDSQEREDRLQRMDGFCVIFVISGQRRRK